MLAVLDSLIAPARRAFHILLALLQAHLMLARSEAKRDGERIMGGLVLLGFGLLCLAQLWLMLHALAVLALRDAGLGWPAALGVVCGADLVLALGALLLARGRLSQPVLVETRELVRKTLETAAG